MIMKILFVEFGLKMLIYLLLVNHFTFYFNDRFINVLLQVEAQNLTAFRNSLLEQLNTDSDKYDVTEAIANLDETCNKLESLQSMLKVLSDEDEIGNIYLCFLISPIIRLTMV